MFKKRTALALLTSLSLFSTTTWGDVSQCVSLAKIIVSPEYQTISENELKGLNHYAFCQAETQRENGTLDVAYEAFNLSADFLGESKDMLCSKSIKELGISQREYRTGSSFFAQALPTINECIKASNEGWDINFQKIQNDAVGLGISHSSETGGKVHGIDIIPTLDAIDCKGMPEKFPITVTKSSPITMTCVRSPKTTNVSGVTIRSSEDATINLRLASGPVPITLPGYSGSIFDGINSQIGDLQMRLNKLTENLNAYNESKQQWNGSETTKKSTRNKVTCPQGEYLVGIKGIDTDRGEFCASCISDIEFYCRPLPGIKDS